MRRTETKEESKQPSTGKTDHSSTKRQGHTTSLHERDRENAGPRSRNQPVVQLQRSRGNQATQRLLRSSANQTGSGGDGPDDRYEQEADRTAEQVTVLEPVVQRTAPCSNHTTTGGNCAVGSEKKRSGLQTKLKVNEPGDIYEQEADRVADQVMAASADRTSSVVPSRLQRLSGQSDGQLDAAPDSVDQTLSSPGRSLEPELRQDMEQRFGHDFSRVRVHTGGGAEKSAQDVNANAYTVGHHIVFGPGRFAPGTQEGRRLIAHELTHVVQQLGSKPMLARSPDIKGAAAPGGEADLRVRIVDALEAARNNAVDAVASAIRRGDRAYLEGLGLTSKQVNVLLTRTPRFRFNMVFGTAVENSVELAMRANPSLGQYIKRGPTGRVPTGVGKPDWIIETPSSRIPVELTTTKQLEAKQEMWRRQTPRGKPKSYMEKGVNMTYDIPSDLTPPLRSRPTSGRKGGKSRPSTSSRAKTTIPSKAKGRGGKPKGKQPVTPPVKPKGKPGGKSISGVELKHPSDPVPQSGRGKTEPSTSSETMKPQPETIPEGASVKKGPNRLKFPSGKTLLKLIPTPADIAGEIPEAVLDIADRAAAAEARRTIQIKFAKEGYAKGVAAGVMGWSQEEVDLNLKNRVTSYRIEDLGDPAGFLSVSDIFQLSQMYENYAVNMGYKFGYSQSWEQKKYIMNQGFSNLRLKYDYNLQDDPQLLFETDFIVDLAEQIRHITDPKVDKAIQEDELRRLVRSFTGLP